MKRPLCGLVTVFALGIVSGAVTRVPLGWWYLLAAVALAIFLACYRLGGSLLPLLLFVGISGAIALRATAPELDPGDIACHIPAREQNITLRGVIITDPAAAEAADRQSFVLQLVALQATDSWQRVSGRLYLTVSKRQPPLALQYGDLIECSALLRVPAAPRNPGEFDWPAWLRGQGIAFTATSRATDQCVVLATGQGNPWMTGALRLKERLQHALRLGLEDVPELAGVLAAIIIGERSEIPPDTYADFQRTGVFHIFAISGLHVGLVAVVLVIVLQVLRVPRRWSGLVAIPLVVLYVLATGARPGAVRAMLMTVVWLLAVAVLRPADQLNNLAAAGAAVLVWNPRQLFDGGFILSFTVVAGLIVLTPPIDRALAKVFPRLPDPLLPRPLAARWVLWLAKRLGWLRTTIAASTAAGIALLPLMAWYFHLFTPVSILANVIVVPLLGLITATGLVTFPAALVCSGLAATLNNANYALLTAMIWVVDCLSRIPWGHRFVQAPPLPVVLASYLIGAVVVGAWRSVRARRWMISIATGTALLGVGFSLWSRPITEITAFDLREGVAVFVDLPGERQDLLVDGGTAWSAQRSVLPALRAAGVDRLGSVIATCGTRGRVEGLTWLLGELPVGEVVQSGLRTRSKYYECWQAQIAARNLPVRLVGRGDSIPVPAPLTLAVLHPPHGRGASRSEDNSVVLLLAYGPTRVLLTGDAGAAVEAQLLAANPQLRAELILCGINAANPGLSDFFLDQVQPEVVIVTASLWPSRRYPEPTVAERLAARGIRYVRTDEAGAVTVRLKATGYEVRRFCK